MQNVIAVVFDFDDTLAPDSTSGFLHDAGVDTRRFWQERVRPLMEAGWDPVPAYLRTMILESDARPRDRRFTDRRLRDWGARIRPYNGVARIFNQLRAQAQAVAPDILVEFYLVSSGIGEILRATRIARQFTDIWACDFHCRDDGSIEYPRNIVSFTDKTRYLFHIAKGIIGPDSRRRPFEVNRKLDRAQLRVPMDQMIFVGDGYTDIPCFSLIQKSGGIALGVYDAADRERWGRAWGFITEGRVANLHPADYGKRSGLRISLLMAVEHIAKRIALRRQTYQG
jgi:FMN phosphatase YigB (HAD superfamily)